MTFAEKVFKHMLLKGLNQQKLARLTGVSDSEISRILRGKSSPSLEYASRLARALELSLDYLADEQQAFPEGMIPRQEAGTSVLTDDLVRLVSDLGDREVRQVLETVRSLGLELALDRLLGRGTRVPLRDSAALGENKEGTGQEQGSGSLPFHYAQKNRGDRA